MFSDFKHRSFTPELLDNEDIPTKDLYQNLRELDFINRTLGGHQVVLKALKKLWRGYAADKTLHIAEIGSGGGDNLRAVAQWGKKHQRPFTLTGIDMKADCTGFAKQNSKSHRIEFITSDYRKVDFKEGRKPDIIFNSLFCHHFTDEQLAEIFRWMVTNSALGFTICDLHRHPLAYHSIRFLTRVFSKSYLVRNDAPLSVLRGFKKPELQHLLQKAGITDYEISWAWAFRWIVTVRNEPLNKMPL